MTTGGVSTFFWIFFALSLALIIISSWLRTAFNRRLDTALQEVGGIKMVGYETLIGAVIGASIIVSMTLHSEIQQEHQAVEKMATLLRWRSSLSPELGADQSREEALASALTNSELYSSSPELADMLGEAAALMIKDHCTSATSLHSSWFLVAAIMSALVALSLLQAILTSWHLTGLRILMPTLVFSLLACVLASAFTLHDYIEERLQLGSISACPSRGIAR